MTRGLTIVACALAGMGALPALAAAGGPLRTAVAEDREFSSAQAGVALSHVRAAGATLVRTTLSWYTVAPSTRPARFTPEDPFDPAYRWRSIDAKVKRAIAHGLEPFLAVNDAPVWARTGTKGAGFPPDPADLALFLRAAAGRYSGSVRGLPRVRYWQIWIEPNVNKFFSPQFSGNRPVAPARYRAIVNAAAEVLHSVRRDNSVIAGSLSPFTVARGATRTIGPLRFMREMLCMSRGRNPRPACGQRAQFDIWAHHPYTSGGPRHRAFHPDDVSLGDLPEMTRLLYAARRAGHIRTAQKLRFWVTEFGWDTKPPDPRGMPMRLQARWTSEALYRMWLAGVSLVTWLKLRDDPYPALPVQGGLYFRGRTVAKDRPKATLTAFRFPFVAFRRRAGVSIWGRTPFGKRGLVSVERRARGTWSRVLVLRANRYGIFSRRLRTGRTGFLRARLLSRAAGGSVSLPFSLTPVADRPFRPFG